MGLIAFLKRLFWGTPSSSSTPSDTSAGDSRAESGRAAASLTTPPARRKFRGPDLLRFSTTVRRQGRTVQVVRGVPYRFARPYIISNVDFGDLSTDTNTAALSRFDLPVLPTPEDLANWLGIPLGRVAWLTGRFFENERPQSDEVAHYHFHWVKKKSGGYRLIEAPKALLKFVQTQILRGILDKVPAHPAAHGFVKQRSIRSNAAPHVKSAWVMKLDLSNFYPSVTFSRVVAIFRSLGYSREVAIWLGRLTTSTIPSNLAAPDRRENTVWPYRLRHLPQGAPTSPAIANLSAFSLDVRLSGLAASYKARYTRYADDLTLSGKGKSIPALKEIIPMAEWIVRNERFHLNRSKRRILKQHQRQSVTGIVVNQKLGVGRAEYDLLKAILTNCIRQGPASQNRDGHANFASHLRGRIGHFKSVSAERGTKLLKLYFQVDWNQ